EWVGAFPTPIPVVGKSNGPDTQVVQMRLLQLGFWLQATDGKYGVTTRQAVMAFQKYVGLPANGEVDEATATALTDLRIKAHGMTDAGTLIEVDKTKQLLFAVTDGKTQWVFNTSTATGQPYDEPDKNTPGKIQRGVSITPNGLWKTDRERAEGWWEGDLGEIYRPKYFKGGVAIHGSNSIPNYPASHGCVRVSVPAMDFIWDSGMIPLRTTVWVHGEFPG
ncbi:MAG TPA: L,D-transpeptidase family protein, partial [Ilumatobacteraceae bacterium]|nr:L,D-transpeptidase family protein [Ilumatobacteraceae bacterium]